MYIPRIWDITIERTYTDHRNIQGNKHADRLAKAGLKRKAKDPFTSLSYLKRKANENILAGWKQDWKDTQPAEKGKAYTIAGRCMSSRNV
jgi:hypothetical protein